MTTWVRQNKTEIELNDEECTQKAALKLGWVKKKDKKPKNKTSIEQNVVNKDE